MLINEQVALCTNKVLLVPYCRHHVTTYHDWMQDPDIQIATASEPLTIEAEYAMQQSWRTDTDKLTFIVCMPTEDISRLPDNVTEIASMIGDINLFVSNREEDDGSQFLVGELELMIAIKDFQRKGLGRCTLLIFLYYVLRHEKEIIDQFSGQKPPSTAKTKAFDYFVVKVHEQNGRSLSLFEGVGFEKTSSVPSYFGEFELRRRGFSTGVLSDMLAEYGIGEYHEVAYDRGAADTH